MVSRRVVLRGLGGAAAAGIGARRARAAGGPIVYWSHNYPSLVDIVSKIMAPGFKRDAGLDVQYENYETNQLETKILTAWSGGGGPDIVSVGDNNLPNYVYRKLVAPVDPKAFGFASLPELIAAYQPGSLDGFMVGGQLYGIPMDSAAISMYYRRDLFKEAGLDPDKPPTTWDEVAEYGRKLVKKDSNGNIVRAGWSWEARSLSSHFYYWGTLLPQKGVDFLNAEGTRNGLDNAGGHAAFEYLFESFNGKPAFAALGLAPVISPIDDFGAGRTAMINSGFWLAPSLEQQYPAVTYKDGVYGVARLPQFTDGKPATRLNPWIWAVNAKSAAPSDAWRFVAFMTNNPKNQEIWVRQAQYIQPWKDLTKNTSIGAIPYAHAFLDDSTIGVPTPRTPKFNQLATLVARAYDQVSASGDAPDKVVPALAKGIDRMLEG
jgi:ABC-type glycerol-3-phosphate transport system substrate-binding protein